MPEFVDHPTGVVVPATAPIIMLRGVTTSTDLNAAGGVNVGWDVTTPHYIDNDNWYTEGASTGKIFASFTGVAWVSVNLNVTSTAQRPSVEVRIEKGIGGYQLGRGSMGYIRNASLHVRSSIYLRVLVTDVTPGDWFRVYSKQDAEAGAVNPIEAGSYFAAERVA